MENLGGVTLFYKALTVIDAAVLDHKLGLVGQSWYLDIKLIGKTDEESVIADFSKIKNKIKKVIDEQIDHKLIVNKKDLQVESEVATVNFNFGTEQENKSLQYKAPVEAFCILSDEFNEKFLEAYMNSLLIDIVPPNVLKVETTLRSENAEIMFHYTHGLKQHYGNCQRLFHGHYNTIEIWRNGRRDCLWEKKLTQECFKGNIHFAFWENVQNKEKLMALHPQKATPLEGILSNDVMVELAYESSQGNYFCTLPATEVYFLPCETTIENLASYFAQWIKSNWAGPQDEIVVVGYEGIGKGALAKSN